MISLGVPAGPMIAYQIGTSELGMPSSVSVGISGNSGCRVAVIDVEQVQLARLDVRNVVDLVHHLHGVGQQVVERIGAAAVGHVQDVDAGAVLQHLEPQVRGGAQAGRPVGQLARIGLGVVDHLLEGLGPDRGMHREAGDEIADAGDRQEAVGVVRRLAHVRQHGERRVGAHQEGVAVAAWPSRPPRRRSCRRRRRGSR